MLVVSCDVTARRSVPPYVHGIFPFQPNRDKLRFHLGQKFSFNPSPSSFITAASSSLSSPTFDTFSPSAG